MLRQLSREVRDCYAHAEDCALQAAEAATDKARDNFLCLEKSWLELARSYQFLEQLGSFTAHNKQRRGELSQRLEQHPEARTFVVIDGNHRTASQEQEEITVLSSHAPTRAKSQMEAHAAKLAAGDPSTARLVEVCATAGVELLHYPVPADRQLPGQTMAVGTISRCLKRYREDTLITALQCITQTTNNKPGALTARVIKSLCAILASDPPLRDSGLALFEKFDRIDLQALSNEAAAEAVAQKLEAVEALIARLRRALDAQGTNKTSPSGTRIQFRRTTAKTGKFAR
jgi:hypothetical protein